MTWMLKLLLVLAALPWSHAGRAQAVAVREVPARSADVGTLDGLMRAFYEVVNTSPRSPRQWDRDRTLYVPWVRFIATSTDPSGAVKTRIWTHQQYVDATEPLVAGGFKEWEVSRKTKQYRNIAHIDSVYAGEAAADGTIERFTGLNSIEAYFDGSRWWISSVMWMSASPEHPIPGEFLEQAGAGSLSAATGRP